MKTLLLSITTCLLIFSCNSNKKIELPTIITASYDSIVYYEVDKMQASTPSVFAINIVEDTQLDTVKRFKPNNYTNNSYNYEKSKEDSIQIIVDNSALEFHTSRMDLLSTPPPPPPPPIITDSIYDNKNNTYEYVYEYDSIHWEENLKSFKKRLEPQYKAYPVFIYNYSNGERIVELTILHDLQFILEAKDKNNDWKPIEYLQQRRFVCGTGERKEYLLKPKHFMLSAVKRYKGDYKTQLRVKFYSFGKIYYSNTYTGYINYSQFDQTEVLKDIDLMFGDRGSEYVIEKTKRTFLY